MADIHKIIEGLQILATYCKEDEQNVDAQHDVIYAGPGSDAVSEEDAKKLEELGWMWDDSVDSWRRWT